TNLSQILDRLKENGFWIASASDRGSESWQKISGDHLVLILGSEGEGVKRILMEKSDYNIRIPMHGKISSMNVSVACGILLDRIVNRS
ncbi:MAG TPA: TrmH family RNA methyltransferase, partial [Leptospiraceae bacterium]|nr:TrmH family RNA methyltransferase [Leptospiraceae bacterium]